MEKVICLNPNTGSSMKIDAGVYQMISEAIIASLSNEDEISYTELVKRVRQHLSKKKTEFPGSVSWYTVTVKNNMQSRGQLEVFTKQGKKLHKLPVNK